MNHTLYSFVNDQFVPTQQASLALNDLGLQRGYGIFDFLRVSEGRPLFVADHLTRFYHSAAEMRLPVSHTPQALQEIVLKLIEKNNLPSSGIRLLLTGGYSADGYQIALPNLVLTQQVIAQPAVAAFEKGIRLVTYPHQRQLPHVKTTDYLMAIWLQPWIRENDADEVLYHHKEGVSECPRSNFFIVTPDQTIVTPDQHILKGITRKQILSLAAERYQVEERNITLRDLEQASEAFISSSTKRIIPVTQINGRSFGPPRVARELWELFIQREQEIAST